MRGIVSNRGCAGYEGLGFCFGKTMATFGQDDMFDIFLFQGNFLLTESVRLPARGFALPGGLSPAGGALLSLAQRK